MGNRKRLKGLVLVLGAVLLSSCAKGGISLEFTPERVALGVGCIQQSIFLVKTVQAVVEPCIQIGRDAIESGGGKITDAQIGEATTCIATLVATAANVRDQVSSCEALSRNIIAASKTPAKT